MKAICTIPLCVTLLLCANVAAVQLPLGYTEAAPCAPKSGASQNSQRDKTRGNNTPQQAMVQAIVEGDNLDSADHLESLQACANTTAKEIDLRLLAAQPSESNSLFKRKFLQCVEEQQIPVQVYFVALKVESSCESEGKKTR